MVKSIKKSFKYFIIFLGIIIMVPTMFYFILRVPLVQTMLVRRITSHISEDVKSKITVGKVEFHFFNRLYINDILFRDQNNDTLIYSQKITAAIRKIDFKQKTYRLGRVKADNPLVAFTADTSGLLNISWYIDMLRARNDTLKKERAKIDISQIDINNGRFLLARNEAGAGEKTGINFNSLHLSDINCILEDFSIYNDTTTFNIYNLGFSESGGFKVKRLNSEAELSRNYIRFNTAFVESDSTILNISHAGLSVDSSSSFRNFIDDVRLDILLDRSEVSISDLQYFTPSVSRINESFWISGKVMGTVSELRGRNIEISCLDSTYLDCDFDFSGLPDIDNSFIYFGVNDFRSSANDIEKVNIRGNGPLVLPDIVHMMGTISFDGTFTGFTTDFVTYGKIRSDQGVLKTDISMRPEESNRFRVNGLISGSDIALGYLLEQPEMIGNLSMNVNINGVAYSMNSFSGDLSGLIDSIEINDYKYRNINLNGSFTEKTWDGSVSISEKNIRMDVLGMFNFNRELPEFDFTLNLANADLHKLNFDKADTTSSLSMLLTANIKGSNIDNVDGEIKLLNSSLKKFGNTLELYNFSIKTFIDDELPAISLRTDYVDADLLGYYDFSGLGAMFNQTLAAIIPSHFAMPEPDSDDLPNYFSFNINFKNTDKLNNFFRTGLLISENSYLNGEIFSDSIMKINGEAKKLSIGSNTFNDLSIEGNLIVPGLYLRLKSSSLDLPGESDLKGFAVNLDSKQDTLLFNLHWDNNERIRNRGEVIASCIIKDNINSQPFLYIDIDSSNIYNADNLWKISHSYVAIDSNSVNVNNLNISNKERHYLIDGTVSENPADTLNVEFSEIDISPLSVLSMRQDNTGKIPLEMKGFLNGNVILTDFYKNPLLESDLEVSDFSMLESNYGDLSIKSVWDHDNRLLIIDAGNDLNGVKMLDLAGAYDPVNRSLNLNGTADKLPVDILNRLLGVFASDISGTATGKVTLSGEPGKLVLDGALMVDDGSIKIDYLQTRYTFNDSIRFDENKIIFRNLQMFDERGNIALLNGSVNHDYFKDYRSDLMITTDETMVLNTRPKDNELFYGTVFATGVTTIKNNTSTISFDISAQTDRNTRFYIPLNSTETISDYSYITFIDHDTVSETGVLPGKITEKAEMDTKVNLSIDLEVTPDAEVQLIFDSKIGDVMKGHGSGNLNISLDPERDFGISGDYVIEDGDYLFTLGNIFNKPFSVENGGTINFNGDINDAQIDIKAIYKLKASLYEILQDERYDERIPVECHINLSGNLFNPVVGLDIFLPMADEATRTYLKNVITTEEELSRQFLYLLVMNSFYSDPSYGSSLTATTTTGTSAMAVTTTEMVSNQLSNWVSQISNDFDIGFVYRPGYKDLNSNEVELALSTQLLNDKVIINGNFDVRGPGETTDNTDQLIGDFDIEYKLTENIRFKVFNRFNNPYTGRQNDYTQGFGVLVKKDFDRFSDLFRKRNKSDLKKEEEEDTTADGQ